MAQTSSLSNREREVVNLLLQGKSNKMMASALGISERTVEFHLKNIYAKFQVSTRIELILKLGSSTGPAENGRLGISTVARREENAENRDTPQPGTGRAPSFKTTVSMTGGEIEMKDLLVTRQAIVGVITAFLTGFVWISVFQHFGHMSFEAIQPWIAPLAVTLAAIGLSVGLAGRRRGNSPARVFLSTAVGTGLGAFAMIPLMGLVVYPLGKLAEGLGLINRSAISTDVTSALVIAGMIVLWLISGAAIGLILLFVTFKKPGQVKLPRPASEHGL